MRRFSLAARSLSGSPASLRSVPEAAESRVGKALIWRVLWFGRWIFWGPLDFSPCSEGGELGRDHPWVGRKLLPWYTSSALTPRRSVSSQHPTVNREVRGHGAGNRPARRIRRWPSICRSAG